MNTWETWNCFNKLAMYYFIALDKHGATNPLLGNRFPKKLFQLLRPILFSKWKLQSSPSRYFRRNLWNGEKFNEQPYTKGQVGGCMQCMSLFKKNQTDILHWFVKMAEAWFSSVHLSLNKVGDSAPKKAKTIVLLDSLGLVFFRIPMSQRVISNNSWRILHTSFWPTRNGT